ncbi:MAG: VOC family protein [Chloroflexi bacterium]|nr:VOC family protein [Chloroflexota bacterium]
MLKRVDNIGIAVRDLGRTLAFFQEKLGVAPSRPYEPGQTGNSVSLGDVSFYIFQTAREDSPAVGRTPNFPQNPAGIDHIAIEVEDIEDAGRQLEGRGVVFVQDIVGAPGQFRYRGFEDPDGNMFYIIQRAG